MRKCIGCGECCGHYLPMTAKEIADISLYAHEHGIEPRFHLTDCCWLAKNRTCAIYKVRPAICRAFHCERGKATAMQGNPSDYHVYNTTKVFMSGDMTHYDGLIGFVEGTGHDSFLSLFKED